MSERAFAWAWVAFLALAAVGAAVAVLARTRGVDGLSGVLLGLTLVTAYFAGEAVEVARGVGR